MEVGWDSKRTGEGGFALPLVIMITTIIMLLSTAFLTLADTEQTIAQNQVAETQALYIADAGIEKALHVLNKNANLLDTVTGNVYTLDVDVGGGTANVTIAKKGGLIQIDSVGSKGSVNKKVVAKAMLPPSEFMVLGGTVPSPAGIKFSGNRNVQGKIMYGGDFEVRGSRTITSDFVVINGKLELGSGSSTLTTPNETKGILYVKDTLNGQGTLSGSWTYNVGSVGGSFFDSDDVMDTSLGPFTIPSPEIDFDWYKNRPETITVDSNEDLVSELELELQEPCKHRIIYFEGAADLSNLVYRGVNIVVIEGGPVTINGKLDGADPSKDALLVITDGDVTLDGGGPTKLRRVSIVAQGDVTMKSKEEVYGSIWASDIKVGSNGAVNVVYDEDMVKLIRATRLVKEYSYRLVSWQEQYPVFGTAQPSN